ncbi:glycoside hydrolase family 5 protein [Whalleya microplaca]|nr:glycoside hydrolase family 5 protein [Whalleya microplaca]
MPGSIKLLASLAALCSVAHAWLPSNKTGYHILGKPDVLGPKWLQSEKVRGVNLGSLFVFEPWLCGKEWKEMGCENLDSEWDCVKKLGEEKARSAFAGHWSSWITEKDFDEMRSYGLNTVRVPLGFWINEDLVEEGEYYPKGGLEYLLKICEMASSRGFYIMLEMHGAPGVQVANNSFTGHATPDVKFYSDKNFKRGVEFLKWLTNLAHTKTEMRNVGMIGVVNEPEGHHDSLRSRFYPDAYKGIRQVESTLNINTTNKLHISFMNSLWGSGDPKEFIPAGIESLAFEDHRYQKHDTGLVLNHEAYIDDSCTNDRSAENETPTFVTEWCISPPDSVESSDPAWVRDGNEDFYRAWFRAQVLGYEKSAAGWTYWTWKSQLGDWRWSYQEAVAAGIIPKDLDSMANSGICGTQHLDDPSNTLSSNPAAQTSSDSTPRTNDLSRTMVLGTSLTIGSLLNWVLI